MYTMYEEYMHSQMSSSNRETGPRGTIGHDDNHVWESLNGLERSIMSWMCSSNQWTFALYDKRTTHKNTQTLVMMIIRLGWNRTHFTTIIHIHNHKHFPFQYSFSLLHFIQYPQSLFTRFVPKNPDANNAQINYLCVLWLCCNDSSISLAPTQALQYSHDHLCCEMAVNTFNVILRVDSCVVSSIHLPILMYHLLSITVPLQIMRSSSESE